ncbi:MAG: hypothetical protein ABIG44_04665 [Planctomycetota bacterium]
MNSAFIPLPGRFGDVLRLLGPPPDQAGVAVDPFVKLDTPLGVVQSFVAGLCDARGELVLPLEIPLLLDPTAAPPGDVISLTEVLACYRGLPKLYARLPVPVGCESVRALFDDLGSVGPLLYCRKRHLIFVARSPNAAGELHAVPAEARASITEQDDGLATALLFWDGPAEDGKTPAIYCGRGGNSALGQAESLDQLILDQGKVVRHAMALAERDPAARQSLCAIHPCCDCPERERCYPAGDGYAYALDRLVVAHAGEARLPVMPLGEWRLSEATRIIGGVAPAALFADQPEDCDAFESWRRQRALTIESSGPRLLLGGEGQGRELVEIPRLKLALINDLLSQLDAAWRVTGRPHLCWNEDTLRVTWNHAGNAPATNWSFRALLRKVGMQPASGVVNDTEIDLPYPPAYSTRELLPAESVEAARYFAARRSVNVFVKTARGSGDNEAKVHLLLEELGIAGNLFHPGDWLRVAGRGWEAGLTPAEEQNPDDGAGLGVVGTVHGDISGLKEGEAQDRCTCRWYPWFNEAVDLHVVGMLLFDTLLTVDEREEVRLHGALAAERKELTNACQAVPLEQREQQARTWIAGRCDSDAPAAVWSRRNLLFRREDRASTVLDALTAELWQAVVTYGLRLMTMIPGFSFCPDRTAAAPRTTGGQLLPLVELRGLIALLDDHILQRTTMAQTLRATLRGAEEE